MESLDVMGVAVNPSVSVGTRKPRTPFSVMAQMTAMWAIEARPIQRLAPVRTQVPSGCSAAVVAMEEGSEPAVGSVRPKQPMISPLAMGAGRCSSGPRSPTCGWPTWPESPGRRRRCGSRSPRLRVPWRRSRSRRRCGRGSRSRAGARRAVRGPPFRGRSPRGSGSPPTRRQCSAGCVHRRTRGPCRAGRVQPASAVRLRFSTSERLSAAGREFVVVEVIGGSPGGVGFSGKRAWWASGCRGFPRYRCRAPAERTGVPPSGCSILMTSAPRSASDKVA